MAVWMRIAAVLAGLFGLAAVVTVFGLPPRPSTVATAPETDASKGASPANGTDASAAAAKPADGAKSGATSAATASDGGKPADASASVAAGKAQDAGADGPSAAKSPATAGTTQVAKADPQAAGESGPEPLTPPTFDIVRVLPTGEVVVAGRAAPNATVELLRNGTLHQKTTADAAGQFAMVPPNLAPGSHDLTLVITLPDGRREVSRQSVAVSVPAGGTGNVVVALASPDKPTQILSALPSAAATPAAKAGGAASTLPSGPGAPGERPGVVLGSVEVEESGRFFATGRSAPGAIVRLYLNDTFLAAATASPEGTWSFAINRGVEPGSYRVRIDDVDGKGTVVSRAEVPFEFGPRVASPSTSPAVSRPAAIATGPVLVPGRSPTPPAGPQVASTEPTAPGGANVVVEEIRTTTVSRGDSLWRISKRIYGKGLRYTVIYEANQKQIRDPRLIYPGQLFVLPGEQPN